MRLLLPLLTILLLALHALVDSSRPAPPAYAQGAAVLRRLPSLAETSGPRQAKKATGCKAVTPDRSGRWYVYRDGGENEPQVGAGRPVEREFQWANYMPKEASEMLKVSLVDETSPAEGTASVRVDVNFLAPKWCGVAVAPPGYWGETQSETCLDLSRAKSLVFMVRGANGRERLQVKVGINGDKKYGDSSKEPASTGWIELSNTWSRRELPLGGHDLSRVITPFSFVTDASHNVPQRITFFFDEIHYTF